VVELHGIGRDDEIAADIGPRVSALVVMGAGRALRLQLERLHYAVSAEHREVHLRRFL
jgi:hypothetical protein